MANWAVVIGIDRYVNPENRLKGAVRDADRFAQWLLKPTGGNVLPENLTLLLEPDVYQPTVNAPWGRARYGDIVRSIEDMLARSGGRGERFFLYFAGHGLSAPINFAYPSAILSSDFEYILPNMSFTLPSLFELFQGTEFGEQYFFIDACRNLPFDTDKRLGDYPNPRKPMAPVSPQYAMHATQPGVIAREVLVPGDEGGVFTAALLQGLEGEASAKLWDTQQGNYVVRWSTLFKHVESTIVAIKDAVPPPNPRPLIQEPRQFGEHGAKDPELGRFDVAAFPPVPLDVDVTPVALGAKASITVGEMGPTRNNQPPPLPVTMNLPPRAYWVDAQAPGFRTKGPARVVELYSRSAIVLDLEPVPPPPPMPAVSPGARSIGGPAVFPAIRGELKRPTQTSLVVSSVDPLSQIEIADESGNVLARGRQRIDMGNVAPGLYRGRLMSPEGAVIERVAFANAQAGRIELALVAPTELTPAMRWVMAAGSFVSDANGLLQPSETVGSAENLKLSTMLAMAAGAHVDPSGRGQKLRKLPMPGFHELAPGASCGIQVVLGDERMAFESLAHATVECWPIGCATSGSDPMIGGFVGTEIRTAALLPAEGSHWLKLSLDQRATIVMPVVVASRRLTLVTVTRELDKSVEIHHYQLPLEPDPNLGGRDRDPYFNGSQFAALRRIELMQRSAARGRISSTSPDIALLLDDKWLDPLAGCLGGYLLVRQGRWQDLDRATQNLVRFFPELPDSWVLRGEFLRRSHADADAVSAFQAALNRGVPLLRDGAALLQGAAKDLGMEHGSAALLNEVLSCVPSGSLWTAGDDAMVTVATQSSESRSQITYRPLESL